MLVQALELHTAIDWACWKFHLNDDKLSQGEWEQLKFLITSLKAFSDCTQASEGRFATVEKMLPTMNFLLEFLSRPI
jgi:hypothetical protein